jgi:hypothetical protein
MGTPSNNKMQRTKRGWDGASPLISVLGSGTTTVAVETIRNDTRRPMAVCIEPWAETVLVSPSRSIRIVGRSATIGAFEREQYEWGALVYAWSGCTVAVYETDQLILDLQNPVPPIPVGLTMSVFMKKMFAPPENWIASPARRTRPWWRSR